MRRTISGKLENLDEKPKIYLCKLFLKTPMQVSRIQTRIVVIRDYANFSSQLLIFASLSKGLYYRTKISTIFVTRLHIPT